MVQANAIQLAEISLQETIQQAIGEASNDAPAAAQLLEKWVRKDRRLFNELMMPYLSGACWDAIRRYCRREKRSLWTAPRYHMSGKGERVIHLAENNARSLFDFRLPLPGLPRLGDSNKEQVQSAEEFYQSQAKDMHAKAYWLHLIVEKMSANTTVRQQLSEELLLKLQQKALAQ